MESLEIGTSRLCEEDLKFINVSEARPVEL